MKPVHVVRALLFSLLAIHAGGDELRAPISGFVFDTKSAAVRPIDGFPGGASLGNPLDLGQPLAAFAYSPRTDVGIAAGSDGNAILISSMSTTPSVVSFEARITPVDRVAIDSSGEFLALYSSKTARIQVTRRSDDATAQIDVSGIGDVHDWSLENGSILLSTSAGVYYWNWFLQQLGSVADSSSGVSAAFRNGGRDVILADRAKQEVLLITDVNGARRRTKLAGAEEGVRDPVGVLALDDGSVVVTSGAEPALLLLRPDRGAAAIPVSSRLNGNQATLGANLVALTSPGNGPLLVLDTNLSPLDTNPSPSVWFVPAPEQQVSQ